MVERFERAGRLPYDVYEGGVVEQKARLLRANLRNLNERVGAAVMDINVGGLEGTREGGVGELKRGEYSGTLDKVLAAQKLLAEAQAELDKRFEVKPAEKAA